MGDTNIEWTDKVWNPTVGCSIVSPGCSNCYAMKMAGRLEAMGSPIYRGHTIKTKAGFVWNGKVAASNRGQMIRPLSWKKPARIFVNSMSDLFHEDMPDEVIDQVFAVMALCPQHTFQVLTKRAGRMRAYLCDPRRATLVMAALVREFDCEASVPRAAIDRLAKARPGGVLLGNVHGGTSVEDQPRADERIPELLATPLAVRFLSCEPLLGPVDLTAHFLNPWGLVETPRWVILGGESGPNARPYRYEWARDLIAQCAAAGVPAFHKQVGAHPIGFDGRRVHLRDRKGGDPALWPEELRVREMAGEGS